MRMLRLILVVSMSLSGLACSNTTTGSALARLDRPGHIAFVCAEVVPKMAGETSDCNDSSDNKVMDLVPLSDCEEVGATVLGETHELFALITQTARGEVAAINITTGEPIDIECAIPGFTYQNVGESPSGLAVPTTEDPDLVYVASFTNRIVRPFATSVLLSADDVPLIVPASDEVELDDNPSDLVLREVDSDTAFLYTALGNSGAIAEIETDPSSGSLETPTILDLDTVVLDLDPLSSDAGDSDFHRFCPADRDIKTVKATMRTAVAGTPRPARLLIDTLPAGDPILLVADAGQPVIHRYTLTPTGATPLDTLKPGVPVKDIALTPFVPEGDATTITKRYLYAIDATDNTVLVMDYSSEEVIPVHNGVEPRDRITRLTNARSLEIITPGYPRDAASGTSIEDILCDSDTLDPEPNEARPTNLRGVFLATGTESGRVRFTDVFDLDAICRGGIACTDPEVSADDFPSIRRHRPRIGNFPDNAAELVGRPFLFFNNNSGRLDESGAPVAAEGPGLEELGCSTPASLCCFDSMDPIFPSDESEGRICVSNDIWSTVSERWLATWEGTISNTRGGFGLLDAGAATLTAMDADFCAQGVLGSTNITASALTDDDPEKDPGGTYTGDQWVLLSELSPAKEDDEACARFVDLDPEDDPIGFAITTSTPTVLTLDPAACTGECCDGSCGMDGFEYTLADIEFCYPHFLEYEIRTLNAFTVEGAFTGFLHRVIDSGGSCLVDTAGQPIDTADPDTYINGRAFPEDDPSDLGFINPLIAFKIGGFTSAGPNQTSAQLLIDISNPASFLQIFNSASAPIRLPQEMEYLPVNDRFYVVDALNGVGQFELNSLGIDEYFR